MDYGEFEKLSRFFTALSVDPEETELPRVFCTLDSIKENCKKYFGQNCEFFTERLHAIISENMPIKRINFKDFKEKFYDILLEPENSSKVKTSFIFQMLDFDSDGVLNATDLLRTFEAVSMDCKFGRELHRLMTWFTEKNIKQATQSNKKVVTINIDYDRYLSLLPNSM